MGAMIYTCAVGWSKGSRAECTENGFWSKYVIIFFFVISNAKIKNLKENYEKNGQFLHIYYFKGRFCFFLLKNHFLYENLIVLHLVEKPEGFSASN